MEMGIARRSTLHFRERGTLGILDGSGLVCGVLTSLSITRLPELSPAAFRGPRIKSANAVLRRCSSSPVTYKHAVVPQGAAVRGIAHTRDAAHGDALDGEYYVYCNRQARPRALLRDRVHFA